MSTIDRFDEDFQEWRCSDCDPDLADPDAPDDPAHRFDKPFVMLVPRGEPHPDYCPRCNSYLSLCEGADRLHVSNRPVERWAAERFRAALLETLGNGELCSADGSALTPELAERLAEQVHAAAATRTR